MTEEYRQHPITPPPELVQQWVSEYAAHRPELPEQVYLATRAAQYGADQELEACCEWFVRDWTDVEIADKLRTARRPKPPSLAEEALALVTLIQGNKKMWQIEQLDVVRRALEKLQELEGGND